MKIRGYNRLPVLVQQRGQTRGVAVPMEQILYTGFLIDPDLRNVNYALTINFFKAIHRHIPLSAAYPDLLYS